MTSSAIGQFVIGSSPIGVQGGGQTYYPVTLSPQTDIRTIWDVQNSQGDWVLSGADLLNGDDLATAVLISFFSDRVANQDDVIPDGTDNRRGWWGDTGEDFPVGSRMWLLERAKLTQQTPLEAEQYAAESLDWMISDGVIRGYDVAARIISTNPGKLAMAVVLYKTDGTRTALNFAWVWNGV